MASASGARRGNHATDAAQLGREIRENADGYESIGVFPLRAGLIIAALGGPNAQAAPLSFVCRR